MEDKNTEYVQKLEDILFKCFLLVYYGGYDAREQTGMLLGIESVLGKDKIKEMWKNHEDNLKE
jgi:hypothetical protein